MQGRLDRDQLDGLLRKAFPSGGLPGRDDSGAVLWPEGWSELDRRDWSVVGVALEPWPAAAPLPEIRPPPPKARRRVKLMNPIAVGLIGAGAAFSLVEKVW